MMRKLSRLALEQAVQVIFRYGRPLERKICQAHFSGGSFKEIINELKHYQNPDGGFGME